MEQLVKSSFEENIERNFKSGCEKRIEAYKKEHEKKEIESEKSIEEQLKELMEADYNDLEIDYEALFKALTKWA
jgi:hypothetical protein